MVDRSTFDYLMRHYASGGPVGQEGDVGPTNVEPTPQEGYQDELRLAHRPFWANARESTNVEDRRPDIPEQPYFPSRISYNLEHMDSRYAPAPLDNSGAPVPMDPSTYDARDYLGWRYGRGYSDRGQWLQHDLPPARDWTDSGVERQANAPVKRKKFDDGGDTGGLSNRSDAMAAMDRSVNSVFQTNGLSAGQVDQMIAGLSDHGGYYNSSPTYAPSINAANYDQMITQGQAFASPGPAASSGGGGGSSPGPAAPAAPAPAPPPPREVMPVRNRTASLDAEGDGEEDPDAPSKNAHPVSTDELDPELRAIAATAWGNRKPGEDDMADDQANQGFDLPEAPDEPKASRPARRDNQDTEAYGSSFYANAAVDPDLRRTVGDTAAISRMQENNLGEDDQHGYGGMLAVGNSVMNRATTGYGNLGPNGPDSFQDDNRNIVNSSEPTIDQAVVNQINSPAQYSWTDDPGARARVRGDLQNDDLRSTSWDAARDAYYGNVADPTGGATMYHTVGVHPDWAPDAEQNGVTRIGEHLFSGYADNTSRAPGYSIDPAATATAATASPAAETPDEPSTPQPSPSAPGFRPSYLDQVAADYSAPGFRSGYQDPDATLPSTASLLGPTVAPPDSYRTNPPVDTSGFFTGLHPDGGFQRTAPAPQEQATPDTAPGLRPGWQDPVAAIAATYGAPGFRPGYQDPTSDDQAQGFSQPGFRPGYLDRQEAPTYHTLGSIKGDPTTGGFVTGGGFGAEPPGYAAADPVPASTPPAASAPPAFRPGWQDQIASTAYGAPAFRPSWQDQLATPPVDQPAHPSSPTPSWAYAQSAPASAPARGSAGAAASKPEPAPPKPTTPFDPTLMAKAYQAAAQDPGSLAFALAHGNSGNIADDEARKRAAYLAWLRRSGAYSLTV
jgi:hypothetical protein